MNGAALDSRPPLVAAPPPTIWRRATAMVGRPVGGPGALAHDMCACAGRGIRRCADGLCNERGSTIRQGQHKSSLPRQCAPQMGDPERIIELTSWRD
jgi:hypothetical protein